MKILLLGKSGQVGWELQRALSVLGEVVALDRHGAEGLCGDLSDLQGLAKTVRRVQPQVIANAAAYTAVDKAEGEPELARTLNAQAPDVLAREAQQLGAWLVHYSTDYVFDGSGDRPWRETDAPAPLSVYGQTKLEGERQIVSSGCRHLIFRTSWVYAVRGNNFAKTILRLACEREQLSVVNDQIGAPTGADLLADVTAHALRHVLPPVGHNNLAQSGIYHLTASGEASWYDYARFVLENAIRAEGVFKLRPDNMVSVPSSTYSMPARRPHNSRLDTAKLRATFGLSLPDWRLGVSRMLAELFEGPKS
ncbi:dTDP-4-dehydrorhamnose reductase [Curvibacter delicatus]|uniref:dTDP-4-dehydrorhamnose reductase n=1 Tax=Curvibacter delicatus TaxID=80879 RepID=UPI00082C987E|nr:dTDP-4-dehydrorhamnose reductase [Curvibacter delicatus]